MIRTATIQLHHLDIGYHSKHHVHPVVTNLEATLHSGQMTCLLGANGVGKSTLLRTLSAFLPPLAGEISLMDKPLSTYSDKELARTISVVLTERIDVPDLLVTDVVGLGRTPYTNFLGQLSANDYVLIEAALHATGITHLAQRKLHTLSDGERQKAMIAKALAQDTPIILLDEPTAFLDYPSKVEMMQLLHHLSYSMQKTIFLSTHDLDLALQIADCVWLLDNQGSLTTGLPEALILNGILPRFFHSEGVCFDASTGYFSVNHHPTRSTPLGITGHGLPLLMLCRALHRLGFTTLETTAAEACPTIDIITEYDGSPCFLLTPLPKDSPQRFTTIDALIKALETIA